MYRRHVFGRLSALASALLIVTCAPVGTAGSAGASPSPAPPDARNATFVIDRDRITLAGGRSEREAAPGSATKTVTTLAEQQASVDVDRDGRPDTVVILIHQPGGSGTFFYLAVLLNAPTGASATGAVLLGDRIKVSSLRGDGAVIVVEMLDRSAGQALTASPTVAVTKRFAIEQGALVPR
jgi:hypothetical protein